ncbi:MAG: molybdopterin-dependent oxidoreductase, partial [Proteobacteria bacterium]|nr:molybdopterin-dependent oxidoreductase [Pseudomonadota bacterium]
PYETVKILEGDTDTTPYGMGTGVSRCAVSTGGAVRLAVQDVKRKTLEIARFLLNTEDEELEIEELFQGVQRKPEVLESLREKYGIVPSQAAFMGDDIQDIPLLKLVGIAVAVQNAAPEVKESSDYVTRAYGGHGAVREVAEWLLELRGQTEAVMAPLLQIKSERESLAG